MFIKQLHNRDLVWEFTLVSNKTLVGRVCDYSVNPSGIPIMIQIMKPGGILVDLPWDSILFITQL